METPALTPLAAAALHVGSPERVLEIECGEGDGSTFLAREFPRARIRGVDRSERAIRVATGRIGLDPEGRVAFKVGSPRALPFPDGLFDLVAIVDAKPRLAEVARVLRPGGRLILAYSRRSEVPSGLPARFRDWRLSRLGIEPVESADAGDGRFSVARLRGGERRGPSD